MSHFSPRTLSHLDLIRQSQQTYRAPVALPASASELLQMIKETQAEILRLFSDGHSPQHKEVTYRLAFLVYKVCQIEEVGGSPRETEERLSLLFAELEVPLHVGVELAAYRYQRLCAVQPEHGVVAEQHVRHIDEIELVVVYAQLISGRSVVEVK